MKPTGLLHLGLLAAFVTASACTEDVGICQGSLQGRDTVRVNDTVLYGGQAIMNKACAVGCHSSTATGDARHGVPAGLDFDLSPVDQEDAAGTRKRGKVTVVKLTNTQVAGLRARQKKIVEQRSLIWQQIEDGLMPPSGMLDAVMDSIFASSEKTPCERGKPYSMIPPGKTREVLRNWLACGAPLVETNSPKVDKRVATPGAAGYQYQICGESANEVITLDRLFVTTLGDCGRCHNSTATPAPRFASVEVLEETLRTGKSCRGKPFVTPFDPEESYLLDLLKGPDPACGNDQMPEGDPLSERGIAEVEAWIAAGAPTTASDATSPTSQDVDRANSDDDEPTTVPSDDQEQDPPKEEQEPTPIKDAGMSKDDGATRDAGAAKDAGRDAGKDAGRDAGR